MFECCRKHTVVCGADLGTNLPIFVHFEKEGVVKQ